ncbi:hypothetical protein [Paucibacter sp. M5-1]|uniref:hypothetical protein n=1 Tax=Paucibacter sp. M5-1 TaxID=3015998 RepID=UPI0022B92634|nr:hypothetical protein [Paucibacter sp. M5-1]MCZ7882223.1 hypothetical protein [Paucibacter sp. M5-1]
MFAVAFGYNAFVQTRFMRRLRQEHPSVWVELGQRKVITEDADRTLAAAQLYLLAGEYKLVNDVILVQLGRRAVAAFYFGIAIALAMFIAAGLAGESAISECWSVLL